MLPICDFASNWANGLKLHITKKHTDIEQVDGNNSYCEDLEDEDYLDTDNYWKQESSELFFRDF